MYRGISHRETKDSGDLCRRPALNAAHIAGGVTSEAARDHTPLVFDLDRITFFEGSGDFGDAFGQEAAFLLGQSSGRAVVDDQRACGAERVCDPVCTAP